MRMAVLLLLIVAALAAGSATQAGPVMPAGGGSTVSSACTTARFFAGRFFAGRFCMGECVGDTANADPQDPVSGQTTAGTGSTVDPDAVSTDPSRAAAEGLEQARFRTIEAVAGSVVAIYDAGRQGGGSGVLIDASGLALTNHHVIMGAGVSGKAGLNDGRLYDWELVATDPGGDLALIRLLKEGPFPAARLGNSDRVRAGDWALAMGNPFVLAEDHVPTITLGIVSGVRRYQEGAGLNELVYGNCIQVDSSINPGNSGGPLFDMAGTIIGINGRASFLERGRVNVELGYAISANQARNFLGELMATCLVQHGTLDASFGDYSGKGILCSRINELSDAARAGLELGDRLLELEDIPVQTANEVASLICTLPRGWPTRLRLQKPDGSVRNITVRLTGLPYQTPAAPPEVPMEPGQDQQDEQKRQEQNQKKMLQLLATPPGTVRSPELNRFCLDVLLRNIRGAAPAATPDPAGESPSNSRVAQWKWVRTANGSGPDEWSVRRGPNRGFWVEDRTGAERRTWYCLDGKVLDCSGLEKPDQLWEQPELANKLPALDPPSIKRIPALVAGLAVISVNSAGDGWFRPLGEPLIDGSDKADGVPAIRLKQLDSDKDWFYAWLSTGFADAAARDGRGELIKVSADLDSDGKSGGALFRDWFQQDGWQVPRLVLGVRGIDETVETRWTLAADVEPEPRSGPDSAEEESPGSDQAETAFSFREKIADAVALLERATFLLAVSPALWTGTPGSGAACSLPQELDAATSNLRDNKQPDPGEPDNEELPELVDRMQPRIVKLFGAGAGQVEAYSTGVLVSPDGLIVTSQGVYLDGARVIAVLADGTVHEAAVIRRDRNLQLALLKIDAATPDHFSLEGEREAARGEWVVTLNNAFRVADKQESVSAWLGIVALPTSMDARLNERDVAYSGRMILIDSITSNPGAAGGALITLDGELLGVVGKIIESSETNTRLNYAVPLVLVRDFVAGKELVKEAASGAANAMAEGPRGNTGIVLFELGGKSGPAFVDRVAPDSPAAVAGILADDLVISIGGEKTANIRECQAGLQKLVAGVEVVIVVKRDRELLRFSLVPVADRASEPAADKDH